MEEPNKAPTDKHLLRKHLQTFSTTTATTTKITHPLARYDHLQLKCVLCPNVPIRNTHTFWNNHLTSDHHLAMVNKVKRLKQQSNTKRKPTTDGDVLIIGSSAKKPKVEQPELQLELEEELGVVLSEPTEPTSFTTMPILSTITTQPIVQASNSVAEIKKDTTSTTTTSASNEELDKVWQSFQHEIQQVQSQLDQATITAAPISFNASGVAEEPASLVEQAEEVEVVEGEEERDPYENLHSARVATLREQMPKLHELIKNQHQVLQMDLDDVAEEEEDEEAELVVDDWRVK